MLGAIHLIVNSVVLQLEDYLWYVVKTFAVTHLAFKMYHIISRSCCQSEKEPVSCIFDVLRKPFLANFFELYMNILCKTLCVCGNNIVLSLTDILTFMTTTEVVDGYKAMSAQAVSQDPTKPDKLI